jgi:hypothetical protein
MCTPCKRTRTRASRTVCLRSATPLLLVMSKRPRAQLLEPDVPHCGHAAVRVSIYKLDNYGVSASSIQALCLACRLYIPIATARSAYTIRLSMDMLDAGGAGLFAPPRVLENHFVSLVVDDEVIGDSLNMRYKQRYSYGYHMCYIHLRNDCGYTGVTLSMADLRWAPLVSNGRVIVKSYPNYGAFSGDIWVFHIKPYLQMCVVCHRVMLKASDFRVNVFDIIWPLCGGEILEQRIGRDGKNSFGDQCVQRDIKCKDCHAQLPKDKLVELDTVYLRYDKKKQNQKLVHIPSMPYSMRDRFYETKYGEVAAHGSYTYYDSYDNYNSYNRVASGVVNAVSVAHGKRLSLWDRAYDEDGNLKAGPRRMRQIDLTDDLIVRVY